MKKRIIYIVLLYLSFMLTFSFVKPIFMLCNGAITKGVTFSDYLQVILHGISLDITVTCYFTAIPLLMTIVSCFFPSTPLKKILQYYYALVALFISIVIILDIVMYGFWDFKLDMSIFLYTDSPTNAFASVSFGFIVLRIVLILVFAVLLFWMWRVITPFKFGPIRHKIFSVLFLLLLCGVWVLGARGGIGESTANISKAYYTNKQFLNHSAVNPVFNFLYSIEKGSDFKLDYHFFEPDVQKEIIMSLFPTSSNDSTTLLNTTRPNILLIILEGMGGTLVETVGGIPDITPRFNAWSKKGILFTDAYANSYRTDRGLVSILSGYLSFPVTSVTKLPSKSKGLPSIAGVLDSIGYSTSFVFGGDIDFTNMRSYLLGTGFSRIVSDKDFSEKERHTHAWGVNDDIMFDFLLKDIAFSERSGKPFFTTLLTLSSHEPWKVPYHRLQDEKANSFAYTDEFLGQFLEKLEQTSAWEDLLVILLPDHGINYPQDLSPSDRLQHHIPILWLGGAVREPQEIDITLMQSDIAATLLDQMELPHDKFNFSRNVLSPGYQYPFLYYTFNNGLAFADSTGTTVFDLNAQKYVTLSPSPEDTLRISKGKAILQESYNDLMHR